MSLHKLTTGSGYTYLTRQVAALDATDKGGVGLAAYYTARGETPGRWIGSGLAGIDGITTGDAVTAKHMQNLFGSGHHPLADERETALAAVRSERLKARAEDRAASGNTVKAEVDPVTPAEWRNARRLGTPFKVYDDDFSPFRIEVARRIESVNAAAGLPRDAPMPASERAKIRTDVAREFFRDKHGREAADARELAATIAKNTRPRTTAVAGFDLTFSPVKSVSTLWAIADLDVARRIEAAHDAAVRDALTFLERHALYTRTGANGVRQVDVTGLVATAFTHRDSRAGDPDLHTHVAVANKVQTRSADGTPGRWLSIDGRVLYKAAVAASETYNTALEKHLGDDLGLHFGPRAGARSVGDPKRVVREVVGVDPGLNARWSTRRARIDARRGDLAAEFQTTHGRPPSPVEALHLAQQATLETREAKHEPRSLEEQRKTWRQQASDHFGQDGERRLDAMVDTVMARSPRTSSPVVDAAWCARAASDVVAQLESRRATWQTWHVRAEVQRQVRKADLAALTNGQVDRLVDHVVDEVITHRSVSLARPIERDPRTDEPISEPAILRRGDGSSVYDVAGAEQFTAASILAAEQRIVAAAGRRDGHAIAPAYVDLALLETSTTGPSLNAGQAALVRSMATSGARVQLAVAPAGSGKTTAMRALTSAWTESGGEVIGLAPSAAAATQLGDAIGGTSTDNRSARADTLAKLIHSLTANGDTPRPEWVEAIGPTTLVVIDEAGMADTLSLDRAIAFALERGASVRLIGDDQQLAAIGAGGVLRDIAATHGALNLSELMRFADPAEGSASLALREGDPTALGFYLDNDRVHVGDLTTLTEKVFDAWRADRDRDVDSLMLAPTRELVSQLNQRAQAHRLIAHDAAQAAGTPISEGAIAYAGDIVITRTNDRRLRTSMTDWVKNGDRWDVLQAHNNDQTKSAGDLTVRHRRTGRTVRLPADYVTASVELGYASTIHTAQGVSADTTHGLAHDNLSRQLLYTMLTRGREANHIYLPVVGDGDPHSVIRPEIVLPDTATDLLERIVARDDSPTSATSLQREQSDAVTLLGDATIRYLDALHTAAETVVGTDQLRDLDEAAERASSGLTEHDAWPALRSHLALLAASGADAAILLADAADQAELTSAVDVAAVLDWRLDDTGLRSVGEGPLPWLPALPASLSENPTYGDYLSARARLVSDLAAQVRSQAVGTKPAWARHLRDLEPAVLADLAVWRAATQVDPTDRRPTGPPTRQKAQARYQRHLNQRIRDDRSPALLEWGDLLAEVAPDVRDDSFVAELAERLAAVSRAGIDASGLVRHASRADHPLGAMPDDHAAAALWWRISKHLTPAVSASIDDRDLLRPPDGWAPDLERILGHGRAGALAQSAWWPTLVTAINHAVERGWQLDALLPTGAGPSAADDDCQGLAWRVSLALDPTPDAREHDLPEDPFGPDPRPDDLDVNYVPRPHHYDGQFVNEPLDETWPDADLDDPGRAIDELSDDEVVRELRRLALDREVNRKYPREPSREQVVRQYDWAAELANCPIPEARMLEVNAMAHAYFEEQLPGSWGQHHLRERFHIDLAGHPLFRPGQAPEGWTRLSDHLRGRGVTDQELLVTGLATTTRHGRLIDRFRDRVVLPITAPGYGDECVRILGFVGRRHPDLADTDPTTGDRDVKAGPKYLNTSDTPLFHKGAQLYAGMYGTEGVGELLDNRAVPVLVEGPIDAAAVTLSTFGAYVGLAPLGTSLTEDQASQLASLARDGEIVPVVATDRDAAGRVAAERSFWMLAEHDIDPLYACLPDAMDPASLLTERGPADLAASLAGSQSLARLLMNDRVDHVIQQPVDGGASRWPAVEGLARIIAARDPRVWTSELQRISAHVPIELEELRRATVRQANAWEADPQGAKNLGASR